MAASIYWNGSDHELRVNKIQNEAGTYLMLDDNTGVPILKVDKAQADIIVNEAGTGAPNFPLGFYLTSAAGTDYVTDNFTPVIEGSTTAGVGTYTTQFGRYLVIGDLVLFEIILTWTAHTGTGNLYISGLPFTVLSIHRAIASIEASNLTYTGDFLSPRVEQGTTRINLNQVTKSAAVSAVPIDTSASVLISGSYIRA